jgi:hypothetical protein
MLERNEVRSSLAAVMPARPAAIFSSGAAPMARRWIPAFAGMTPRI